MAGSSRSQSGFSLIELTITIVISAIVIAMAAMFITQPVQGYLDQSRRAELVDAADSALRRMGREVRRALPNSVRITSNGAIQALELLSTVDGARYRAVPPPGQPDKRLQFSQPDSAFNSVGRFEGIAKPFSSTSHYLSIYNVGVPGADAYELANVITPPGTRIDISADTVPGEDNVRLTPAFRFAYPSPRRRMYLVDGPVTYLCDPLTGSLSRYSGYTIDSSQASRDSAAELLGAGASESLVADKLVACAFTYTPGTAERAGLLSAEIAVGEAGETITLLHQVHIDNVP
jgi:MSHA biogenesis protein MshO